LTGILHHIELERELGSFAAVKKVVLRIEAMQREIEALPRPTAWDYFARELKLRKLGHAKDKLWSTTSLSKKRLIFWIEDFERGPIVLLHAWDEADREHSELVALMYALKYKSEMA
jgi:hypothetical protein